MPNYCAKNSKSFEGFLYKLTLTLLAILLFLTMSIYSISSVNMVATENFDEGDVVKVLLQGAKDPKDSIAKNTEESATTEERKARQVAQLPVNSTTILTALKVNQTKSSPTLSASQGYYEEQQPVVVHAESGVPILGYPPQRSSIPPQNQELHYADYLSNERPTDSEYDDQRAAEDYLAQDDDDNDGYYKRGPDSDYYADSVEQQQSRNQQYDSYYRQFATPTPTAAGSDRKLQPRVGMMDRNRNPYANYGDTADYDFAAAKPVEAGAMAPAAASAYTMSQKRKQQQQQQQYQIQQQQQQQKRKYQIRRPFLQQQQQQQQYRPRTPQWLEQQKPTTSITTNATPTQQGGANTLLSVVKQLKTMWDVYQAFTSAWNTLAERHQKTQEQQQEKTEQQQQTRINSKQPPKYVATQQKRNRTRTKTTTTTATITTLSTTTTTTMSPTKASTKAPKKLPTAKVEPRKSGSKDDVGRKQDTNSEERKRRAAEAQYSNDEESNIKDVNNEAVAVTETAVAEGRYIKGDPLKGYYDFVITEGSYKFWAVFQVGTALLIIYSTFAAIYYSKVNPLVSDYDYTDYLGGARSLTGGDADFVDDDDAVGNAVAATDERRTTHLLDWMPKAGHSMKFILDAIDKLPVVEHADGVIADGGDVGGGNVEEGA